MTVADRYALAADCVFDGEAPHEGAAIVVEGARISALLRQQDVPASVGVRRMPSGVWLAPGFIDLQVNGGGDVLFNAEPTPAGIAAIVAAHRQFGTTAMLPTLITDTDETMRVALAAVQEVLGGDLGVLGIHLEGPFLSHGRPGVHNPELIRRPELHHLEMLTSLRGGATLVTLAPEAVPASFIAGLAQAGVTVSLGHSMATYDETRAALADGLTGFTHLFNAMRPLASREPGPIAAALECPHAYYGLIVDGLHVDPAMLRLALRGVGNPMLVTDAMPPVGGSRSSFTLNGAEITVRDGRCTTPEGTLAGAALDMASAVRNCRDMLGLPLTDPLRLASRGPARFLGLDHLVGRLAPGCRADIVALDPGDVTVRATWVGGRLVHDRLA